MHDLMTRSGLNGCVGPFDERFRQLVDHAPFFCWASGPNGCTYVNRPWLEFRGRKFDDELGDGWLEGIHPEDRLACLDVIQTASEARQFFRVEYRLRRADGEYRRVADTGIPQFTEDLTFLGYMGTGIEIHNEPSAPAPVPLTPREVQVLSLVAEGKTTKEVAADLSISYKTADSHRTHIMKKLGVHQTASLVRYAIRQGLISA